MYKVHPRFVSALRICAHFTPAQLTNGSEDGQIHCLKEGEVGAEAAWEISKLTAEMFARGDDGEDDSDPFASCDEEMETNDLVVYDD